jgi:pimeloyl-ACP methyl ester carboxylesterase
MIGRVLLAIVAVPAIALLVVLGIPPRTPHAVDQNGEPAPDGVAVLEEIELGDTTQWILARGSSSDNPVLLFLHGGPGMPAMYLHHACGRELERDFIVVHWDQRGAGKSWDKNVTIESMNVRQIMSDALELIELLRERYEVNKIYLAGHSWGSYLGMLLVNEHPRLFHAYVGIGQVTDEERQGALADMFIVRKAREVDNRRAIAQLGQRGEIAREKWLFEFGGILFNETGYGSLLKTGLCAPEYSIWDALNVAKGSRFSSNHMRYNVILGPLMEEVTSVRVPVYFFQGRHDYVTPSELVEEYLEKLRAPGKKLVWFENSAHYPFFEEPERFTGEMAAVLKDAGRNPRN